MNKLFFKKKVRTQAHILEKEETAWRTQKKGRKPYRLTPYRYMHTKTQAPISIF
jgi:hypothetical protein